MFWILSLSPGRSQRWILPNELETPNRPTSSGTQSPAGAPVQFGPSPQTREYAPPPPCFNPPAQWGDVHGRVGDEECELFGGMLLEDDQDLPIGPLQAVRQPDELGNVEIPPFQLPQQPLAAARCVTSHQARHSMGYKSCSESHRPRPWSMLHSSEAHLSESTAHTELCVAICSNTSNIQAKALGTRRCLLGLPHEHRMHLPSRLSNRT